MAVRPDPLSGDSKTASASPESHTSTIPARFSVVRALGSGGFGAVYSVKDKETGKALALKRLSRIDPGSIYRFKQEFRVLSGLSHPNLVRLHELISVDETWCFTMDQVDGIRFDAWVQGGLVSAQTDQATASTNDTNERSDAPTYSEEPKHTSELTVRDSTRRLPLVEQKLRQSLRQLVQGVLELHAVGILHRDLKPSNVLVDARGRVVILDFGLALNVEQMSHLEASSAGTPAYMSPEQARGALLTTASDWYSVGVMLYEALTGRLPFVGTTGDMLRARQSRDPRDPRQILPGLPDDLCELAMQLLLREPLDRPSGFAIATRVGLTPSLAASPHHVSGGAFVGREREIIALHMAFEESRSGNTVVAHVHGGSGFGKTTVIKRFVSDLAMQDNVVVLEGRCYERESVPFKALDELVDSLGRYLSRLRPVEAAGLMPRDTRSLVRLFPALGRLEFMTDVAGRPASSDMHEVRRRAFAALRELFTRLSDSKTLVLVLDDVHWGDRDSADLIRNLLAPPDVPPALFIAGYRNEPAETNDLLRTLRSPQAVDAAWQAVDIPVGPLPLDDAKRLALTLLGESKGAEEQAALIAEESAQSPLFIAELVRAAKRRTSKGPDVSMQGVVRSRTEALSDAAKRVLQVLAVCEGPLEEQAVASLAELSRKDAHDVLHSLRDEHLATMTTSRGSAEFEIFHDKIRKATLNNSAEEDLKIYHGRLATLMEERMGDPEKIAYHHLHAGDRDKALQWIEAAGDRAVGAAAFDHAVGSYRRALVLSTGADTDRLQRKLAPALGRAGLPLEAAELHLKLAERGGSEASAHRRQAGADYLRAGHTDEALATLGAVLEEHGLGLPRTGKAALISLLYRRARLRFRGFSIQEPQSPLAQKKLDAIDLCWVLGNGLAGIDLVRSAHYNALSLWLSLETGEPARVARTMALDAALRYLEGGDAAETAPELVAIASDLAHRTEDAHALGWVAAARAIAAFSATDLVLAEKQCELAIGLMREDTELTFREIGSLTVWFALHASFLLGRLSHISERAPAVAREAEARGDHYTLSTVQAYILPLHWAAQGRPEEGRRAADAALEVWPKNVWYHQHWAHLRAHCFMDLYEGRGAKILERTALAKPRMKQAFQLRIRTPRLEFTYLEGRSLLDQRVDAGEAGGSLRGVEQRIRALRGEKNGLADVYASALEAALSTLSDRAAGAPIFRELAAQFLSKGMRMHAAASLMRAGEILGGEGGARLVREQSTALSEFGAKDPHSFAMLLVPRIS